MLLLKPFSGILEIKSKESSPEKAIDIELQCDMLYILSTLCEEDLHRKELFGTKVMSSLAN